MEVINIKKEKTTNQFKMEIFQHIQFQECRTFS